MAKRREKPAVNPLSSDLIAAAVAPVSDAPPPREEVVAPSKPAVIPAPPTRSRRHRAQKTLRVRFPDTEFEENEVLTKTLRILMGGSKVTESDITRALWSLARRAEEAMRQLEAKAPRTPRPANGDWMAKAEYDDAVAYFLHLAIKKMGVGD